MQPIDVLLARMCSAEPVAKLLTERHSKLTEPLVVGHALTCPDSTGVTRIADREIAVLGGVARERRSSGEIGKSIGGCSEEPVRRIEKLCCFQNHFNYVLVTVPARTARRCMGQIEDIHFELRKGLLKRVRASWRAHSASIFRGIGLQNVF